jgi:hypothetical protein
MNAQELKDTPMPDQPETLFRAIREKCQQARWFGPDALKPAEDETLPADDPFIDDYPTHHLAPDDPARSGFLFPLATDEQVRATEQRLGIALPVLLRQLYQQVANGGFGPGTGLRGVAGGYWGAYLQQSSPPLPVHQKVFSYASYQEQAARSAAKGLRAGMRVPSGEGLEHLLPLCDLGCCEEIGVDDQGRLFLLAPTENNAFYSLEQLPWTLEQWLWRWVRGERLLEGYRAGAA